MRAISRRNQTPINVQLSEAEALNASRKEQEKKENREIVAVIFDVVQHIALQNDALRGLCVRREIGVFKPGKVS